MSRVGVFVFVGLAVSSCSTEEGSTCSVAGTYAVTLQRTSGSCAAELPRTITFVVRGAVVEMTRDGVTCAGTIESCTATFDCKPEAGVAETEKSSYTFSGNGVSGRASLTMAGCLGEYTVTGTWN